MSDFASWLRAAADADGRPNLATIFEEQPVSLTTFVQDRAFLGNPPLSPVQYQAVRHIERVYYPDLYPLMGHAFEGTAKLERFHVGAATAWRDEAYWSYPVRMVNFATLQWGKGSGKDHVCRVASMRVAYLLMCLASPQNYYGMPEQDSIHLLNVASTAGQAQQAFFTPIQRAVRRGWFADKCEPRMNTITYAKNIESVSGHSDAESQEGLNLMLGIADEIDAFRSKKEMVLRAVQAREPTKSAEGILNMIRTSASTRFPEVYKIVRISYPRYLGSTIQRLTAEANEDIRHNGVDSRHFVSGPLATWQVNPRVRSQDVFAADYAEDPVMARSKYECRPARAISPYFRNNAAIDACFRPQEALPVEVDYKREGEGKSAVWVPCYRFSPTFFPVRGAIYALHGDLAVTADRAGIAMAHVVRWSEHEAIATDDDGATSAVREVRPHVKVDFVLSFRSDIGADPPREIQIRWARQLAFELTRRGFNIRRFSFDGFQCLSGDVEIPLLDGTSRKLHELAGREPFWVYSVRQGRIVPGLCTKAWRTAFRSDMVEVELDNGESVVATSDHLFMLRDGTYRQAVLLNAGDALMPLYRRLAQKRQNHKVVAVRPAAPQDVYDLQIEDHHNFAVGAGVFVHNSTDSMQILEAKGIETAKVSTDMHEDPWRNLRDLLYEGRIQIPAPALVEGNLPMFLLREELFGLTRLPNGRIDHVDGGCFTGETRIPLLDGTMPQIQDLVHGAAVWVYSATPEGRVVPGRARARRTKLVTQLVDVVLDNGYTARCTPEHLWMLRDGSYKPARDLVPGVDRLMPITRSWPVNGGYERVSDKDGRRTLTHTLVVEHLLARALSPGELAHHRNENKTDNRPQNLRVMDAAAHKRHHAAQRWAADSDYVRRLREGHAHWRTSPEAATALAGRDLSRRWAHLPTAQQRHAEMARILPFYRHDITIETLREVLNSDTANAAARALGCGRNVVLSRLRQAGYETWQAFRGGADANHKVRAVIAVHLQHPVPVFDLDVQRWHNFALPGGVFVHNSKDEADALACATLGAILLGGQEEEGSPQAYHSSPDITVGRPTVALPLGVSLKDLWLSGLPELPR